MVIYLHNLRTIRNNSTLVISCIQWIHHINPSYARGKKTDAVTNMEKQAMWIYKKYSKWKKSKYFWVLHVLRGIFKKINMRENKLCEFRKKYSKWKKSKYFWVLHVLRGIFKKINMHFCRPEGPQYRISKPHPHPRKVGLDTSVYLLFVNLRLPLSIVKTLNFQAVSGFWNTGDMAWNIPEYNPRPKP